MKQHVVVLTGAGISAESGLRTFRDADGLWNGYRIEDVATPEAFQANPEMVLEFYNMRRREASVAQPNAAHLGLAALEQYFRVSIITQNVDDLHERAGSTSVLHLHGQLNQMRSVRHPDRVYPIAGDMQLTDRDPHGDILRPNIVWFGEAVPAIVDAVPLVETADALVVIGTSLQVYPAASLVHYAPANARLFILDRKIPTFSGMGHWYPIESPATAGIDQLSQLLRSQLR